MPSVARAMGGTAPKRAAKLFERKTSPASRMATPLFLRPESGRRIWSFRASSNFDGSQSRCWAPECITGPQSQRPLKDGSEHETGDEVARLMGQDSRQRNSDRESVDRPAEDGRQPSGRGRQCSPCAARGPTEKRPRACPRTIPWTWPATVLRSGRVWLNKSFIPLAAATGRTTATSRA